MLNNLPKSRFRKTAPINDVGLAAETLTSVEIIGIVNGDCQTSFTVQINLIINAEKFEDDLLEDQASELA